MMQGFRRIAILAAVSAGLAVAAPSLPAVAQDAKAAIKARKANMQLRAFYLGQLGAMAKAEVAYDAERAKVIAASLAAVGGLDASAMWPQGSDNVSMPDDTRALPDIWTTFPAIADKGKASGAAVAALNDAAGNGLEALQAAMGPVGAACGDCHKSFRQSDN